MDETYDLPHSRREYHPFYERGGLTKIMYCSLRHTYGHILKSELGALHSNNVNLTIQYCRRRRDRMIVDFTTTYVISSYHHYSCEFESRSWWHVLDTTLCDKVCQWLPADQWFSPVSSTITNDSPPRYNWNIVESGVKHHNPKPQYFFSRNGQWFYVTYLITWHVTPGNIDIYSIGLNCHHIIYYQCKILWWSGRPRDLW
jgi:hypothetical protein